MAAILSDPAGGRKWRKVTKNDEIGIFLTWFSFFRPVKCFFVKRMQKHKKWGVNHLQRPLFSFGPDLMTSAQLRQCMTSLWRHDDVMRDIFGFIVILKGPSVTLSRFIANRPFPSFFWLEGHMAPPGLIGLIPEKLNCCPGRSQKFIPAKLNTRETFYL